MQDILNFRARIKFKKYSRRGSRIVSGDWSYVNFNTSALLNYGINTDDQPPPPHSDPEDEIDDTKPKEELRGTIQISKHGIRFREKTPEPPPDYSSDPDEDGGGTSP